jgi:MscS family membrane protein
MQPFAILAEDNQEITESESEIISLSRLNSPRAVWISLCSLSRQYNKIILEEGYTRDNEDFLHVLEEQIATCYDLQEISPSTHIDIAMETTIYLSEIIARFPPIDSNLLPDRNAAFKEIKAGSPDVWYLDPLPIAIARTDEGVFDGEFQVSRRTVSVAHRSYEHFKSLPYHSGVDHNYLENYFLSSGPGLSSSFIRILPEWLQGQYLHNTLWQWIAVFLGLPMLFVMLYFINKLLCYVCKKTSQIVAAFLKLLFPITAILLTIIVCSFLDEDVFATGHLIAIVKFVEYFTILVALIILIKEVSKLLSVLIIKTHKLNDGIDTTLINLGLRLCSIALSMVVILEGLQRMGFSLATVLAGAGVTGLAIALGAQESLRNIFGSLMLLLDKPFVVGQRIVIKGHKGVVESIGLRSTKIKLFSGHITSIPNDEVARGDIENIGASPYILNCFKIALTYDTTPDEITEAMDILYDILAMDENNPEKNERNIHVNVEGWTPKISLLELGAYSLNLGVMLFFHPANRGAFYSYMSIINQEIVARFHEAGLKFAFPSQTLYVNEDAE